MEGKGFFAGLFDLSFSEFITTRVIRVLYGLGIAMSGLLALGIVFRAFHSSVLWGLLCLILCPVLFVLYVLLARVWCELIMVLFRIADNTTKLVDRPR